MITKKCGLVLVRSDSIKLDGAHGRVGPCFIRWNGRRAVWGQAEALLFKEATLLASSLLCAGAPASSFTTSHLSLHIKLRCLTPASCGSSWHGGAPHSPPVGSKCAGLGASFALCLYLKHFKKWGVGTYGDMGTCLVPYGMGTGQGKCRAAVL